MHSGAAPPRRRRGHLVAFGREPGDPRVAGVGAELQVHPTGKFVYSSNRGDDSIAILSIDEKTGIASYVARQSTQGKTPRHFAVDSTGQWLIAENQDSDNVVVFRIDSRTGLLTPTGQSLSVGSPVCLVFVPTK